MALLLGPHTRTEYIKINKKNGVAIPVTSLSMALIPRLRGEPVWRLASPPVYTPYPSVLRRQWPVIMSCKEIECDRSIA